LITRQRLLHLELVAVVLAATFNSPCCVLILAIIEAFACILCCTTLPQIISVLLVLAHRYSQRQLARPQLLQLQQAVADLPAWLWCYNRQCWVGLDQEPVAADDAEIAGVMGEVAGVHLVQLEGAIAAAGAHGQQGVKG
jgi:hypothetical protein